MDAKIDIYGISGDVICSVLITKDAVSHEELMTSDYIQLSWNDDKTIVLPAGAYIIYQDEKYSLIEPYLPLRENEAEYKYTPQFHSRIMIWDKIPVPLYTYESDGTTVKGREMDWDFTGSPADAMYMVKQAIKNETGEDWTIQLSESLPATITISSQSNSIFSLLTSIANECKTEWWADKSTNVLYLSQCKKGTELTLKVGDNVGVPTVTQSKDGYYTRFYVFGSTRNITQDYQGGQATNHIVNKRLTLDPIKYPGGYKDTKGHFDNGVFVSDLQKGEVFIKTLYFDDVYPKSKLTISDVRARLKYRLDTNGNKVRIGGTDEEPAYEQYAIWYFQISGLNFDPSTIIEEKELAVSFESGQLAGRDFKLTYHEKASVVNDSADFTPFNVKAGDFEINIDKSTGNIIPGMAYIIPQNGDDVILYNIEMPDEYVASAQEELELELDKEMESYTCDNNSYEFDSYPVSFYDDGTDLNIGQSVAYVNGDKILHTRVIMVEKRLDFSFQQRIRIGNEIIKGNTQQLKEEVANVNQNIDVIKAFNELSISLSNAYANAQREMIEGFAAIKNIWEFDNDESHWTTDDSGNKIKTIKSKYNVWSSGYISALGTNTSEDSSGTGSFDLLQDWDKYVDSTAKSMALSAFLGKDLLDRVISLEEGQKGHKITISGSGNVVVNVEESSDGGTLTFTKGNIDLSGYATKTELEAVSKKTDSVTQRVDEFLGGSDTDGIINKWKELEAFLDGQQQGTTLSSLLNKKVDKTIQVKAGEGLSGGGALSGNVTLSLATVGTAGTYTKVTVDKYGRVTGHATLSASDIPTLEISKINGLQEELDKKLNISDFGNKFATEMANWFKKDTEGNVFVANSKGFYSESFVSAMGKSSGGSSSGGGSYDRLDNWADYSADRATWVLSAKLGYDLNTRVSSLESGSAINFETSGTGNALTGFSKSGNTVTFTKGTFLTEHQKLYTLTMQRNGEGVGSYVPTADKIININACTAINVPQGFTAGALSSVGVIALSFASGYSLPTTAKQQQWDTAYSFVESIAGSDANGVIDKWNEIISFLDGIGDSSTLEGLLNDINSNVTAVSSRVTKLEGYFVNGVAKEAAKTTGTLSINGKNFNGSASVNVGVIGVSYGGTGKSSVASGSMLYASAANTYAELATTEFGRNLLKANSGSVVSGLYAEAAYKLQNKRTIWGQAFDGTANISGAMYNVSAIVNETSNPYNHRLELGRTGVNQWDFYEYGGVFNFYRCQDSNGENKVILFKINNGSVGILTDTPTHTLHVNGTGYFSNTLSVASQIRIGNGTITWDSTKGCFHFSHGLYSDSFISAMGLNDSGSGGGSASYERLDNWTDYAEEKATWVLSAKLGNELNERLKSVEAGGATSVVTTGTGNVITAISKNGNTITATKGITALTSHQAIYSLTLQGNGTTIGTFNPKSANATINITAANIGAAAASHTHTLSALSDLKAGWSTLLKEDPKAYVTRWPAFSEVTSKPTTLAGYGITDAYTKTDADSRYVNVSGDTMTGALKVPELRFTNGTAIWFDQYGNVTFGSTSSSNWWYIGSSSNSPSIAVNFGTGNVGIGKTASTTYKLEVNGDVHANSFTGSLNGNASTASKWQTARTVTMNGFADCSFSIDGSANVSFDYKPYNFYLSVNNKNNYPWHRIAKFGPVPYATQDKEVTLLLSQGYTQGHWGIVRMTLRTNSAGIVSTAYIEWLNRRGFNRDDVKVGLYNIFGETYADVFLRINAAWKGLTGLVLTQGGRGNLGRTWTLVNSSEVSNTTTTDKLTSTECWTSIEVAAEELHKKAYTNIIEADDAGGVGILYDHGKLTAISGTTMPNEGLRLYRAYNNGYPAAYGNLMSVRGENSGAGELLLEWKGSTELGHIYYRSKRDNTSSGWSNWGTLAFLTDNVASATKLQTARSINGTSFDGTANITTAKWGSYRTVCIQDNARENTGAKLSVDGSTDITLLMPSTANFSQLTISTKLISNGQTDFNKQWLKNVGGIWFGSADSSSVFASFDGDGTQTGLQSKAGTSIYFGWRGGTRAMTIDSAGNVVIGNTSTVNSAYKLDVKGDVRTQGDIVPYSNGQYNIGSSGARWNTLFTQSIEIYGFTPYIDFHYNNSSADYTSRIVEVVSGCLAINGTLAVLKSGNVGIGTTLPTEKLYVSGNIAATGAVTALVLSSSSDIRLKDIRKNVCLSVEEIAKAPAVEFAWKKTGDLAVGSIAQYWQPILPQAIHKRDNYLSMQYDVIALLASIANARRILSIEKKIKELEEEVKRLKIS